MYPYPSGSRLHVARRNYILGDPSTGASDGGRKALNRWDGIAFGLPPKTPPFKRGCTPARTLWATSGG